MNSALSKKIALAMQIAAMLLVQFYSLVPSLSLAFISPNRTGQCRGNHVQCGCAPERIASHTCCCDRRIPSCCDLKKQCTVVPEAGQRGSDTTSLPYLCTASCGGSTNFVATSVQQLKFVLPEKHLAALPGSFFLLSLPPEETASSRVAEPPDPPPKLMNP